MIGNAFNEYLTWVDDASALAFVVSLAPGVLIGSALHGLQELLRARITTGRPRRWDR